MEKHVQTSIVESSDCNTAVVVSRMRTLSAGQQRPAQACALPGLTRNRKQFVARFHRARPQDRLVLSQSSGWPTLWSRRHEHLVEVDHLSVGRATETSFADAREGAIGQDARHGAERNEHRGCSLHCRNVLSVRLGGAPLFLEEMKRNLASHEIDESPRSRLSERLKVRWRQNILGHTRWLTGTA